MASKIQFVLACILSIFLVVVGAASVQRGGAQTIPIAQVATPVRAQTTAALATANIFFTESNNEASRFDQSGTGLSRFAALMRLQGASLQTVEWRTRFPDDADLVVVGGPTLDFSPEQTARLWQYFRNGGQVLLLIDPPFELANENFWTPTRAGLFVLLWQDASARGRSDVIVTEAALEVAAPPADDAEAAAESGAGGQVTLEGLSTAFTAELTADHPITAGVIGQADGEAAALQFFSARSIEFDASPRDFIITPLALTNDSYYGETEYNAYLETGDFTFNIGEDTARGPLVAAVSVEDPSTGGRLVLIGDVDVATNSGGFKTAPDGSASFVYPDNVRFMMNTITWLVERDSVTLDFPTPGPTETPTTAPTLTPLPSPTAQATAAS
ncbi:MAG: hypothetical protein GYB67_11985 [Chloroflexi bacterium]|nr:hypothetical protein [Chloroflexota bacterium]